MDDREKIHRIMRSFRKINRALYQLLRQEASALDLTVAQILALRALEKKPNIGLGELAEWLQVSNSTMSGIVERLVKAGLIIREHSEADRRTLTMRLTPKGEAKQQEAFGDHSLLVNRLSGLLEIPEKDLEHLLQVHQQILEILQRKGMKSSDEEIVFDAGD